MKVRRLFPHKVMKLKEVNESLKNMDRILVEHLDGVPLSSTNTKNEQKHTNNTKKNRTILLRKFKLLFQK